MAWGVSGITQGSVFSVRLPLVGQGCQQTSHPQLRGVEGGEGGGASQWPTVNKMGRVRGACV